MNGFALNKCLTNIRNGPWAGLPYNGTNNAPLGIRNLVGGPCDQQGNGTLRFTATPAAQFAGTDDPIAPGITTSSAVGAPLSSAMLGLKDAQLQV